MITTVEIIKTKYEWLKSQYNPKKIHYLIKSILMREDYYRENRVISEIKLINLLLPCLTKEK